MSLVAAGNADSYTEFGIHCWDIAAGVVILREAGGTVLSAAGTNRLQDSIDPSPMIDVFPVICTHQQHPLLEFGIFFIVTFSAILRPSCD